MLGRTCLRAGRALIFVFGIALAGHARAERYALLVGVSRYPELPSDRQLHGPVNDVQLMAEVLQARGFAAANMAILADGMPGAALPTRVAILGALKGLEDRVKPGDYVHLYFAGHGSEMPTDQSVPPAYRKPNGRQQIILPRDVRGWNGKIGRVVNAIADFELIRRVDALRAHGASVWAVFDACQSGTLVRGDPESAHRRTRFVDPALLGIPKQRFAAALRDDHGAAIPDSDGLLDAPLNRAGRDPTLGGYVAFYAAQTYESAQEDVLPLHDRAAVTRGVFSYTLASILRSGKPSSYRQLGEAIAARYAADNRIGSTPLFTGPLLDAPVFGDAPGPRILQWPISNNLGVLSVHAGIVDQLSEGAILAVLASPMDRDDAKLGYVAVKQASATHADLVPIAANGLAAPDISTLPSGVYARFTSPALRFALRVSLPRLAGSKSKVRAGAVIEAAKAKMPAGVAVEWVRAGIPSDIALRVKDERLLIVPGGESVGRRAADRAPSILLADRNAADTLRDDLLKVAKVLNLLRIDAALNETALSLGLKVAITAIHAGQESLLTPERVASLQKDDVVHLTVETTNQNNAIDVTALYIDGGYGIQSIAPKSPGIRRLEALAHSDTPARVTFGWRVDTETVGLERVLLIAVAADGPEIQDFSYLEQQRLPETRAAVGDVAELLNDAGFGARESVLTRSSTSNVWSRLQMALYSFDVTRTPGR